MLRIIYIAILVTTVLICPVACQVNQCLAGSGQDSGDTSVRTCCCSGAAPTHSSTPPINGIPINGIPSEGIQCCFCGAAIVADCDVAVSPDDLVVWLDASRGAKDSVCPSLTGSDKPVPSRSQITPGRTIRHRLMSLLI